MKKLSICIPTFNRSRYLENCLNSIFIAQKKNKLLFEVCVSDNNSEDKITHIIKKYKKKIKLVFNKNKKNVGVAKNIIKSVSMAKGEFVWLLGNDDLVLPKSFKFLQEIFNKNPDVDFFYINSFNIEKEYINQLNLPFDTRKINFSKFNKFSNYKKKGKKNFFELINPLVSFEFLLSMNLCIYRRDYWVKNLKKINTKNINDKRLYSNFDNTAPHLKIWSYAFSGKKSFFLDTPLSANIHGPRDYEWGSYYHLIEGIRIPEALEYYKKNGMSFMRFFICKNFALRRFIPALYKMLFNPYSKGLNYINIWKHVIKNLLYPSIYFFGIYYVFKRIFKMIKL